MKSMDTIAQRLKPETRPAEPLLCLLNGSAGSDSAEARCEELGRAFAALDCAVEIVLVHDGEPIAGPARKAVARGEALVIAGGGDGTISAMANALAGTRTALAVLPLGTLNHFAKDLGIPLELEAAVANVVNGAMRAVDVAEVNGRVFINNSSIGLYPAIVREREILQKDGRSKWIAFAQALVGVLKRTRSFRVRLKSTVESVNTRTEFVFVGNNAYDLAPPHIGGRNRLDEGVLWVWRLPHTGRFHAVIAALRALFKGRKSKMPLAFTASELSIAMRRKHIDVALDGEVIAMQTPLRYRARPQSLRVIVPVQSS
jgi:diacylglycerol kinase family enzyme